MVSDADLERIARPYIDAALKADPNREVYKLEIPPEKLNGLGEKSERTFDTKEGVVNFTLERLEKEGPLVRAVYFSPIDTPAARASAARRLREGQMHTRTSEIEAPQLTRRELANYPEDRRTYSRSKQ